MRGTFEQSLSQLTAAYKALISRSNPVDTTSSNGLFERYRYPVLTAAHTPLFWRYDLSPATNPHLMERMGINAAFNPGAIELTRKNLALMGR
jgi:4-O-beta-D-mannosyl-D-glucose phosphorylase